MEALARNPRRGGWRGPLVVLAVATLIATACTATPTASPSPSAAAKRGAGGNLTLLWWQAPTILNSHKAQGTKDYDAAALIIEPLSKNGPDGTPVPFLAASIPTVANGGISADLKTVTWKLKAGVKWSDGSDFTADDVVFTYQYVANDDTAASTAEVAAGVESVTAVDATTVKVVWKDPNPNTFQLFGSGLSNILQKKQFAACIGKAAEQCPENNRPIGTGPYKLVEFKPGDQVTYAINDQYRDKDKPFFKTVTLKGIADAATGARAVLQTGDADFAWNMQIESAVLADIAKGGKGKVISQAGPNVERLLLNFANPDASLGDQRSEPTTKHPFLSDPNVRKAFSMAIDRKAVAGLYAQGNDPTCNLVSAPSTSVSPNTASLDLCKFDLTAAGKLLDDAGWVKGADGIRAKGGVKMAVTYKTTVNALRQKEQEVVKQGWTQLGIQVTLKSVPASIFFSSDAGNPDTAAHMYEDVEMFTNGSDSPDQQTYLSGWTSAQIAQKSNNWKGNNYVRYNSPAYDTLFASYKKETDPAKRSALVIQLNDTLVKDLVELPMVARGFSDAVGNDLKGIAQTPWDSELWNIADWTK